MGNAPTAPTVPESVILSATEARFVTKQRATQHHAEQLRYVSKKIKEETYKGNLQIYISSKKMSYLVAETLRNKKYKVTNLGNYHFIEWV